MDISTIVFQGAWADTTDYGNTMTRKYGIGEDANDPCNKEIVQDGGTNYASMIGDISVDGGPVKVRYIHWQATVEFGGAAVHCYEKKRLYASDMADPLAYWYILPKNGGIQDMLNCGPMNVNANYI